MNAQRHGRMAKRGHVLLIHKALESLVGGFSPDRCAGPQTFVGAEATDKNTNPSRC
jgi:hypothetical protein